MARIIYHTIPAYLLDSAVLRDGPAASGVGFFDAEFRGAIINIGTKHHGFGRNVANVSEIAANVYTFCSNFDLGKKVRNSCRSRQMLKNAPTLAIGGVDTAEKEHCEACPLCVYRSPRWFMTRTVLL